MMQRLMTVATVALIALSAGSLVGEAQGAESELISCYFHGAVHGKIEDCGCKNKPLGGVAGRAAMIQKARAQGPLLLLDAGNLFSAKSPAEQCAFLAEETARLSYDAIGVGDHDLAHGVDFLMQQATEHELPFVASNLLIDGERVFPTVRVVEIQGQRLAIVSAMSGGVLSGGRATPDAERLTIQDPAPAVEEALSAVEDIDAVVLLTGLSSGDTASLVENVPGIGLVIDASSGRYSRPKVIGNAMSVAANPSGKYVGSLSFWLNEGTLDVAHYELLDVHPKKPIDADVAARVADFVAAQSSELAVKN